MVATPHYPQPRFGNGIATLAGMRLFAEGKEGQVGRCHSRVLAWAEKEGKEKQAGWLGKGFRQQTQWYPL